MATSSLPRTGLLIKVAHLICESRLILIYERIDVMSMGNNTSYIVARIRIFRIKMFDGLLVELDNVRHSLDFTRNMISFEYTWFKSVQVHY